MSEIGFAVPDHVPADRVHSFSSYFSGTSEEITQHWKDLHEDGVPDIFWTPAFGGHWVATRADDIEEIYRDNQRFTSTRGISLPLRDNPGPVLPIFCDPPEHGEYRRIISAFFTPKRVVQVEKSARELAIRTIESFREAGGCEFYNEFATVQPIQIFLGLAGLPLDDWEQLRAWGDLMVRGGDTPEASSAVEQAWEYLLSRIRYRRLHPDDDPFTALVQGEAFGRKLTDEECAGNANTVLFGGVDTTPATVTAVAHFLATHPAHRQRLIQDRSLIPAACDEFLRRFPATVQGRCAKNDMEYRGVAMKAGEYVLIPGILANLDERRWPDPLTVDFGRIGLAQSVTFGAGIHRCPGAVLARMQLRIFLEEWLERIPEFRLAEGRQERVRCGATMAMDHLPLQW